MHNTSFEDLEVRNAVATEIAYNTQRKLLGLRFYSYLLEEVLIWYGKYRN